MEKYFEANPPQSVTEAAAKIEALTGMKRGETQVRKFLKDTGFRFRKAGTVPAKALTEGKKNEQREFLEQKSAPLLKEAEAGKRIVYFADAVHFVYGASVACLWCLKRIFMPTPSGRNRYSVLGAKDAISHDFVTVCNTTYINALSVCELLEKIVLKHSKDSIPVTIVPDNAKNQRCNFVINRAKELKIELLFLPSYSPNLNIIERLWKRTKKDCLNCKYYSKVTEFIAAINRSIGKIENKENKKDLDSHLALNFQLYDSAIYNRV